MGECLGTGGERTRMYSEMLRYAISCLRGLLLFHHLIKIDRHTSNVILFDRPILVRSFIFLLSSYIERNTI